MNLHDEPLGDSEFFEGKDLIGWLCSTLHWVRDLARKLLPLKAVRKFLSQQHVDHDVTDGCTASLRALQEPAQQQCQRTATQRSTKTAKANVEAGRICSS